jgi:hypothetical protein
MDDFLDLTLDEAAEARIAHAEFISGQKDWAVELASIAKPFLTIAQTFCKDTEDMDEKELEKHAEEVQTCMTMFPLGFTLFIQHMNKLYDILQTEAVKVLGAAFVLQEEHNKECDGTKNSCGHADHWNNQ